MMTVQEVRRARLNLLVRQHSNSMANLCQALGFARNDAARLSRIANGNVRHERNGELYNMGDVMARAIETKLDLARGWMDTPIGYEDLDNPDLRRVHMIMEQLPKDEWPRAIRLLDALIEQEPKKEGNGV